MPPAQRPATTGGFEYVNQPVVAEKGTVLFIGHLAEKENRPLFGQSMPR